MEQIDRITIENDTFALKREYKHALEKLSSIKQETVELVDSNTKLEVSIKEKRDELTQITNDISKEKLDWTQHRHAELVEIDAKKDEIASILKKDAELKKKEAEIDAKIQKNTTVLNENRQLELKLKGDTTALEVKNREVENNRATLAKEVQDFETKKVDFKTKLSELVKIYV